MNKVRVGIVGVGHLGRMHVQQFKHVPQADITGIYDIDKDRLNSVAQEFHVTPVANFETLLQSSDAISIVTPTSVHYGYAKQALEEGKHVFIEKPMTTRVEEADHLIQLAREKGLIIQVGHIERFNRAIVALESLKINPLFIESHRLANFNPRGTDVAVVLDLMIHDIDLILSFVKSPVKDVQASGVRVISTTEDIANCRLVFENGCVANVTASRISARNMRKMRFFQPNAYISIDFLEGFSEVYYLADSAFAVENSTLAFSLGEIEKGAEKREIRYLRVEQADINPLRHELSLFCQSILSGNPPPVTGEDGRRALQVANLIMDRIREHTELVKKRWGNIL